MRHPPICDLHTHSTVSDGTCAPAEVVRLARRAGVSALSLTDHDTTAGLPEAAAEARALGVDFLAGVEISARTHSGDGSGDEIHVLGYGFDPGDAALQAALARLRQDREARIPRILARLRELGVAVEPGELPAAAGGSVGRPHVARALVARGACRSVDEAFDRFLGARAPAFVRKPVPAAADAIALVRAAGGVAVLAHPLYTARDRSGGLEGLLAPLVDAGLEGVEVFHPGLPPGAQRRVARAARRLGLLATGGSDFHGANRPGVNVGCGRGDLAVPRALFEAVRERSGAAPAPG